MTQETKDARRRNGAIIKNITIVLKLITKALAHVSKPIKPR